MTRVTAGAPEPLGVTLDEAGANVAVASAYAEEIHLCLFDEAGAETVIPLPARTGDVFHGFVEGVQEGQRYGFRAFGRDAPHEGQRFNPAKLLIDPYALALDGALKLHPSQFAYGETASADSAPHVAKGVMLRPRPAAGARPKHPWRDTIIYETHVKGFTATHPDVPETLRGTFAGLAHAASIAHLQRLGVTTLELLPCAAWIDERHLPPLRLTNYWGYNPVAMMAPDPRLAPGGWTEVRQAIDALHEAGFEVIVDVVFNHTGESDEKGPTLSLRGLDNATYYRLAYDRALYVNDAGCGNILAFDRAPAVRLAMDALRAWAIYGGVDGFRFDLATTLARYPSGYDPDAPFLVALLQDPTLRELKLVAEPWDMGPGGYQLGAFPSPFGEWNDRYRDTARRFWRGDATGVSDLATRLAGSQDLFARRSPSRSVNFITAHDGFTLRDLVSYARKRNDANGESNRDGADDNFSWNNGVEGESDDAAVAAARARDQRNLLATLFLSRGTPMLAMGAELGHTQQGNNNAYAQDNETSWLDWAKADRALIDATAKLIALRKAHPALRDDRFLTGAPLDETDLPDVQWLRADGALLRDEDWGRGEAETLIAALYSEGDRALVILHRGASPISVKPPEPRSGCAWRVVFDSARDSVDDSARAIVEADAHSALLLVEEEAAADIADAPPSPELEDPEPTPPVAVESDPKPDPEPEQPIASPQIASETPTAPEADHDALIARLAESAGVETRWRDVTGAEHVVPRETLQALLASLGLPAQTQADARESLARLTETHDLRVLPQHVVARENAPIALRIAGKDGSPPRALTLIHEGGREAQIPPVSLTPFSWTGADGGSCNGLRAELPALPAGRYLLRSGEDDVSSHLVVAPGQCHLPQDIARQFGFSAQLYALRREGDQGIGDFTTLAKLARQSAEAGAGVVAINPLHALFAQDRTRVSPYYPSDRRFLDPLYVDLADLLGDGVDEAAARALSDSDAVDYPAIHALKRRTLEQVFSHFDQLAQKRSDAAPVVDFAQFCKEGGEALTRFALFEAICEARGGDSWRNWPQELRDAHPAALAAFALEHATRVRFHRFAQWVADRQFAQAAREAREAGLSLGFCRDLAVGAAPDGAESWSKASRFLDGFAIGAPPDPFSREGQNWGLPAPDPLAMRQDGGADFAELARANMRHAGALRIDHVMGLARLFVVPDGAKPKDGAYVSYPLDALLAQLALESRRARCVVIGEDLGTLPWGFRERLEAENVLSYRVVWFERAGAGFVTPPHYPAKAMACVSTHDLPTLEGWWSGADIDEKESLGLIAPDVAAAERAGRESDRRALVETLRNEGLLGDIGEDAPFSDAVARALHAFAARTPSLLAMAQLDDLAGARVAVNLPGTDRERPNWRRKLAVPLDALFSTQRAVAIVEGLRRILV